MPRYVKLSDCLNLPAYWLGFSLFCLSNMMDDLLLFTLYPGVSPNVSIRFSSDGIDLFKSLRKTIMSSANKAIL